MDDSNDYQAEPLTNEQIWGDPEDFEEDKAETDKAIEEILASSVDEFDLQKQDFFDEAYCCPYCGQPMHLCQCDFDTETFNEDIDLG
jgi:cytochrome c556